MRPRCSCVAPNSSDGIRRREFLKVAGLGFVAGSVGTPLSVMAGPFEQPEPGIDHFVPADKKLAPGWVQGLFRRGVKEVFRGQELNTIGMPVGGIGTGQLYLCGDGTLGAWEIFNQHEFLGTGSNNYAPRLPKRPVSQGFAVVVESRGATIARTLDRRGFADVEFEGRYPVGTVRYQEKGCPVKVQLDALSPFIPLNARDSALPATLFHITIKNTSGKVLRVAVGSWLENAVCHQSASEVLGLRRTRIRQERGRTLIVHTAEEAPIYQEAPPRPVICLGDFENEDYRDWQVTGEAFGAGPARGTLMNQQPVSGFMGKGLVNTFQGGDGPHGTLTSPAFTVNRRFINFLIGGGEHPGETCINLLVNGEVARTATGINQERLHWHSWRVGELEGKEARIEIVDRHSGGWGHVNIDQIELSDERRHGPSGPIVNLPDFGSLVLAFDGPTQPSQAARSTLAALAALRESRPVTGHDDSYPFPEKRTATLLTQPVKLLPGGQHTFCFVLAWHFPNAPNGHEYTTRFADASAVARYVFDHHARLTADTRKWCETYYDSTLPYWLLDRLHIPVCCLATGTCQWWENGRFWAFEGVVCCGGTCTHVWNYAHAHARLFPELARSVREMQDFNPNGGGFHPDTGLVGFRSNDAYAADGQCGTMLKAYREHLMSPDGAFLERNWPRIQKALEFAIEQDGNADGLIENSQHNTYDINYEGANTFVGALYLAALRAAEQMAIEMGDLEFARRACRIYESGKRLTLERLWNGEYFVQDVDLEKHPQHQYKDGCLSDQLFGQGWAHQLGLGYIYPEENVGKTLESVWKYNWAPDVTAHNEAHKPVRWFVSPGEAGLFTCTWPKSKHLDQGTLYKNEVWTGIEYQVAGAMLWEGMLTEALAICRAVHDRYYPLKRNSYNEVECGDHYARAMASWGVFTALAGYEYHGPKGHLGFAPRITPENFRAAFTAAEGWGSFTQTRKGKQQRDRIEVRWGKLRLRSLAFEIPSDLRAKHVTVTAKGARVEATPVLDNGRLTIALANEITLNEEDAVQVFIR